MSRVIISRILYREKERKRLQIHEQKKNTDEKTGSSSPDGREEEKDGLYGCFPVGPTESIEK